MPAVLASDRRDARVAVEGRPSCTTDGIVVPAESGGGPFVFFPDFRRSPRPDASSDEEDDAGGGMGRIVKS
jgi:hypothetical protein